jgi:hypothetical protein
VQSIVVDHQPRHRPSEPVSGQTSQLLA